MRKLHEIKQWIRELRNLICDAKRTIKDYQGRQAALDNHAHHQRAVLDFFIRIQKSYIYDWTTEMAIQTRILANLAA